MNQKSPPQGGTEPPFQNAYWDNKKPGIYVDVVTGKPLFSSLDKYDSGTGWPSFTKPIDETNIVSKEDHSYGMSRTEIKSKDGTHLGHVFDDGPGPSGQRFCVNSASLRFIPVEKLEAEGYGQYLALFQKDKVVKPASTEKAIMAGGCFWGVEEILRKIPGVTTVVVGYTGGEMKNPKYEDVTTGRTGHAEAVEVFFDSSKLSYEELLGYFFRLHDPTTLNRQENDTGTQYRSSIFYLNEAQKKTAEKVKAQVEKSGKWKSSIVTQIVPAQQFWTAEEYHQDYLQKNPNGYMCHWLRD